MTLAIIFDGLQTGGIERVGVSYIRLFQDLGYKVTIYNLCPYSIDFEKEIPPNCEIIHIYFPRWMAPERYAATLKNTWWGRFVYPIAFTVFKIINAIYKPLLWLIKKSIRKKYDVAIAFSGHVNDLTFVAESFVKSEKKVAWIHGALYGYAIISPAFIRLYAKIKNLVSLSNMCDAEFYKYFRKNGINKTKIYNPISIQKKNVDNKFVKELKKKYGDFCLMVGRMDGDDKDQKTVIDAIGILNKKYHLYKILLLAGDGKKRKEYEKYVREKSMENQIVFLGNVSDVQNYYSAATIYVHSSPLEGLPTVLLEAMNYHLPIATTDSIPGVREIVGDNECGLVSAVFDAEGLANNIYRLYMDSDLREKLIKAGMLRIKDFMPEVIENQLKDYMEKL